MDSILFMNKRVNNDDINDISTNVYTRAGEPQYAENESYDKNEVVTESLGTEKLNQNSDSKTNSIIGDNTEETEKSKGVPLIDIFKGNIIILICFIIYSMFPRCFLNLDIPLLCIITMIGLNFYQRVKYGEDPSLNDYKFFPAYITGGVYSLIPNDLILDLTPLIGSIDDVLIVWILVFVSLICVRKRN